MYLWGMVAIENKKYFLKNRIDKIIENSWNKIKLIVRYRYNGGNANDKIK
jgi:hypothetical protein